MLKSLNQTLRGYDNFGVPLSLNINKQQEYKSVCGGVLSVMMTVVLIYILVSGLIGVFNRDTYTIEVQQLQDMDPDLKEMNSNNFMFAIKLDNPFTDYFPNLNKTAFNISMNQVYIETTSNGKRTKRITKSYMLESCTTNHFPSINFEEFHQVENQLSHYLCLPKDYQLWLQGTYSSNIMQFPKLSVSLCKSENCYSDSEIMELSKNASVMVSLSTIIQSAIFMANQTDYPLYQYLNSDFFLATNFDAESTADIFFESNRIVNQNSIFSFYVDDETIDYWVFPIYSYREIKTFNNVPSSLFSVNFRLSQEFQQTTKKVNTIDQFLSYFGGMLKIISSIFGIVALQYNQMGLRLSLANSLYQFNVPQKKDGRIEFSYDKLLSYIQRQLNKVDETINKLKNHTINLVKMNKITRAITLKHQSNPTQQSEKKSSILIDQPLHHDDIQRQASSLLEVKESFLKDLFNEIFEQRNKLKLGINFFFYQLLCCTCVEKIRVTRKMLQQCENVILQDLDIVNILQKLQQIEKLKQALLEKDQIKVFNYTPKPIINVEPNYKFNHNQEGDPNFLFSQANKHKHNRLIRSKNYHNPKKMVKIYNSYSKLKDSSEVVNSRIIYLMGPAMEQIFNKYYEVQTYYEHHKIHQEAQNQVEQYPQMTEKLISDNASPLPQTEDNDKKNNQSKGKIHLQLKPKTLNENDNQFLDQ
ncbi:unnamed protein product (macronuclear) [Paramecium tetraurelia]|uniref:Transmembrane protein n=1 Tax=Paramecium tetraurelia TaxID=5888 RepID=A0CYN8_PARTE|nr:uncharacterized protein GSPATT00011506001 [Paramecium tetraurelia]CAK75905.1 unnamed protein product [Paramecium tetraurelia]|eukprot:XP_001443302.1 hypothetical protein (macronuclear) [Paramecium tetraurelia strain d4-2]